MNQNNLIEGWEKEFDARFDVWKGKEGQYHLENFEENRNNLALDIKAFLTTKLAEAKEAGTREERERVHNELYNLLPTGEVHAFDLIKRIQALMRNLESDDPNTTQ